MILSNTRHVKGAYKLSVSGLREQVGSGTPHVNERCDLVTHIAGRSTWNRPRGRPKACRTLHCTHRKMVSDMQSEHRVTITIPCGRALRLAELLTDVAKDPNFTAGIFPSTGRATYHDAWSDMHRALLDASKLFRDAAGMILDRSAGRESVVVPIEVQPKPSPALFNLRRRLAPRPRLGERQPQRATG